MIFCIKNRVLNKQHEIWEAAPTAHITASKGSSPGPCVHCVGRENLSHRATVNIIHLHSVDCPGSCKSSFKWCVVCWNWKVSEHLKNYLCPPKTCLYILKCVWLATDVFLWKKYAHWVLNELQIVPLIIPLSDCEKCIRSNVKSEWKYGSPVYN